MCHEAEKWFDHFFIAAVMLLSLSLMGVCWVPPSIVKMWFVAWRRRMKKSCDSWNLKVVSFGLLVLYIEGKEPGDF